MRRWQRNARLIVAVFGVLFAAFVARQLKPRGAPPASTSVKKVDPGAVVETTGGTLAKFHGQRQDVNVTFQTQRAYPDGTSKLLGVTIVPTEPNVSRTFTIKGKRVRRCSTDSPMQLDVKVLFGATAVMNT